MSELPDGMSPAGSSDPRDSALGIVAQDAGGSLRLLFGMRSRQSAFLPGSLAFPGGRLEAVDEPSRPRALQRCASREVEEETGVAVDEGRWLDAGERVTPACFHVRFRTRFFFARFEGDAGRPAPLTPAENEWVRFLSPDEVLGRWSRGEWRVAPPLLPILEALLDPIGSDERSLVQAIREVNAGEEALPRIEFVPGIWMLPVRTATLPPATHTNVWMPGGRRFVIVDPGSAEEVELARLEAIIARRASTGSVPHAILLTHGHRDHASGAAALARSTGLPIYAHPDVLENLEPPLEGVRLEPLSEGATVDLDGLALGVLETPGHARGHLAFDVPERGAAIVGDLVSGVSTILIDPTRGGEMATYLETLRRMRERSAGTLLPGHGPPLPAHAFERVLAHRQMREGRVLQALSEGGGSLEELARRVYADAPNIPPLLRERQSLAHLRDLEARGCARVAEGGRWRGAGKL